MGRDLLARRLFRVRVLLIPQRASLDVHNEGGRRGEGRIEGRTEFVRVRSPSSQTD